MTAVPCAGWVSASEAQLLWQRSRPMNRHQSPGADRTGIGNLMP